MVGQIFLLAFRGGMLAVTPLAHGQWDVETTVACETGSLRDVWTDLARRNLMDRVRHGLVAVNSEMDYASAPRLRQVRTAI